MGRKILIIIIPLVLILSLVINPLVYAAPAVALVPVAAELVGELLVAMGVASATAAGTYVISQAYPYVYDTMYSLGEDIGSWASGIALDAYYTDGEGHYYMGNSTEIPVVSASQLILKGSAFVEQYVMPVNTVSTTYVYNAFYDYRWLNDLDAFWTAYKGGDWWLVPYGALSDGTIVVGDTGIQLKSNAEGGVCQAMRLDDSTYSYNQTISWVSGGKSLLFANFVPNKFCTVTNNYSVQNSASLGDYISVSQAGQIPQSFAPTKYYYPNGDILQNFGDVWNNTLRGGNLICDGKPVTKIDFDKSKLSEVYISVGGSPLPPPEDPEDPEKKSDSSGLIPPERWEVFKNIADFLANVGANVTNGGTTVSQYIGNQYILNGDVIVNPDASADYFVHVYHDTPIDVNLNMGGGVNIDVNINDRTELPSVTSGDGSGFFNANAVDVVAGLTSNNPVIGTITGLLSALDPALVGIFSVSVSLLLLLGLWRLIRG